MPPFWGVTDAGQFPIHLGVRRLLKGVTPSPRGDVRTPRSRCHASRPFPVPSRSHPRHRSRPRRRGRPADAHRHPRAGRVDLRLRLAPVPRPRLRGRLVLVPPAPGRDPDRTELRRDGGSEGRALLLLLDLHLEPRSIRLHQLLVQESARFPVLARSFYDGQVARIGRPFTRIAAAAGFPAPQAAVVRACHTLATFGVRYLVTSREVPAGERDAVSAQAASIMLRGVKR